MATFSAHVVTAVIKTPTPITLGAVKGYITLDDSYSPYIRGAITVPAPDAAELETIDPRQPLRVTITATQSWGDVGGDWNSTHRDPVTRTFDLMLRERAIDKETGELVIALSSDEGRLFDYALVALEPVPFYSINVKTIVNYVLAKIGAVLHASSEDTQLVSNPTVPTQTNLAPNPRALVNTAGWVGGSGVTRTTGLVIEDLPGVTTGLRTTFASAGSNGFYNNSDAAPPYMAVTAGQSYSLGAWVRSSVAISVKLSLQYFNAAGANIGVTESGNIPLAANVWTNIGWSHTAPAGAVRAGVYSYGATTFPTTAVYELTALTVKAGLVPYLFFDGAWSEPGPFVFAWTGTANASSSTRTNPLNNDATIWEPGEDAYSYLEPIIQQSGLRLWCDEARVWHLNKSWNSDTVLSVSPENGLEKAIDTISRNGEYYDSVVIVYNWTDELGESHTKRDIAGTGNLTLRIEYNKPYPGPGAAGYVLARAQGKGRTLSIETANNYTATPGMNLSISLPETPIQTGVLSSLTWNWPSNTMEIGSRGLTDTPLDAWILAVGSWDSQTTGTWLNETI